MTECVADQSAYLLLGIWVGTIYEDTFESWFVNSRNVNEVWCQISLVVYFIDLKTFFPNSFRVNSVFVISILVSDDFDHLLAHFTYPLISLNLGHDFKGDFPANLKRFLKRIMVEAVSWVYFGNFFKKLWHEGKELMTVGVNLEVLLLVLIYDMSIGLILLEK